MARNDTNSLNCNMNVHIKENSVKMNVDLMHTVFMFVAAAMGNTMAMVLLWRSRRDNANSVFYRLAAGLIATDMLGSVTVAPIAVIVYLNDRKWLGGKPLCDFNSFVIMFVGTGAIFLEGCLTFERFLAIVYSFFYDCNVFPERVRFVLAGVWVVSALLSSMPLLQVGCNVIHRPGTWCYVNFDCDLVVDRVFCIFFASICLLVISFISVFNLAVIRSLLMMRRITRNVSNVTICESRQPGVMNETVMVLSLVGIAITFMSCYSPLMIVAIMKASKATVSDTTELVAAHMAVFGHVLNPWVYIFCRRPLAAMIYTAVTTGYPLQDYLSTILVRMSVTGMKRVPMPDIPVIGHLSLAPTREEGKEEDVAGEDASGTEDVCFPPAVAPEEGEDSFGTRGGGGEILASSEELRKSATEEETPATDNLASILRSGSVVGSPE